MKKAFEFKDKFRKFWILSFLFVILVFQTDFQIARANTMENYQGQFVTEELRLEVPSDFKEVWLEAERSIWEPWLSSQDGFLGRQIYWDKEREEALILVKWENKKLWKSISMKEVNKIQENFEENVKSNLNLNINPFKLIYEGELINQR